MSSKRRASWALLAGLSVLSVALAVILWLASGRETLTKHMRVVPVTVTDELFGDTSVEQRFVPGPIFGYYVGLDLVVALAVLSIITALAAVAIVWLMNRRRAARRDTHEGAFSV